MEIRTPLYVYSIEVTDVLGKDKIDSDLLKDSRLSLRNGSLRIVARKVKRSASVIARYEGGKYIPNGWLIFKKLCTILSLSADEVLDIIDNPCIDVINNELIRKNRSLCSLSLVKLEEKLGIFNKKGSTAIRYENAKDTPVSWVILKRLCSCLNVSSNDVLGLKVCKVKEKNTGCLKCADDMLKIV